MTKKSIFVQELTKNSNVDKNGPRLTQKQTKKSTKYGPEVKNRTPEINKKNLKVQKWTKIRPDVDKHGPKYEKPSDE